MLKNYLKTNTPIVYTSLDVAEDLKPDIVGSIENMPFEDNSFEYQKQVSA